MFSCPYPSPQQSFGLFRICTLFVGVFLVIGKVHGEKVVPAVIIASVEGEVSSYNMVDDFKTTVSSQNVGSKISPQSLITTGKTGKIALLFSNGALFTIKPGSRFYLRKYKQLEGSVEGLPAPGKLEEEPTQSELSAHLDFGELVVKAPKLKKGSSMKVTSPLGTAGIRGTMFQFMAVRNEVTGDISGGINLISGDIDFTDTNGNPVNLVSGQSLQVGTNRLGETVASQAGELVDLSSTYGNALTLGFVPPTLQMVFPNLVNDLGEPVEDSSQESTENFSTSPPSSPTSFDFIQTIATEIFFEIESAEVSSSEFSFESIQFAPTVEAPIPQTETPSVPAVIEGDAVIADILRVTKGDHPSVRLEGNASMIVEMTDRPFADIDPWVTAVDFLGDNIADSATLLTPPNLKVPGSYTLTYTVSDFADSTSTTIRQVEVIATPPSIALFPGRLGVENSSVYLWQVQSRQPSYPVADDGPFEIKRSKSNTHPYVTASFYNGEPLASEVDLSGSQIVNYSILGAEETFLISVRDFSLRGVNFPDGSPVQSQLQPTVKIVDRLEPIVQISSGTDAVNVHTVVGELDATFQDPGVTLLDNYYSQAEMESHLGIEQGPNNSKIIPDELLFGSVNMEVAGLYELTYQGITDPSGNRADPITRYVLVEDNEDPVVTLNGDSLEYVDLNNTLQNPSSYSDLGATATDNLLRGTTNWESTTLAWNVTIQESIYGTDDWGNAFPQGTSMESIIEEIHEEKAAQSPLKYKITYSVIDKAGNVGFAERVVILESSPYQEPQINVSISPPWVQSGSIGSIPIAKGHVQGGLVGVTVSELPGEGVLASSVTAQIYYDADDIRPLSYSISKYLIDATGNETDVTDTFDISKVNFYDSGTKQYYVDEEGNFYPEEDPGWRMLVVRYTTETAMDKTDSTDLIIRIEDTTPPDFDLVGSTSLTVEAGSVYKDGSFDDNITNISDNYDSDITSAQMTAHIEYLSGGEFSDPHSSDLDIFDTLENPDIGFWKRGTYKVYFEIKDDFNNSSRLERDLTVTDTTSPYIDLIVHSDLNSYSRITGRSVFDSDATTPPEIVSNLSSTTFNSDGTDDSVFVTQSTDDNSSFYLRLSDIDIDNLQNVLGLNNTFEEASGSDSYGRTFKWYSAFAFESGGIIFFRDPGVYVENRSDVQTTISSSIQASYEDPSDSEEDNGSQLRSFTVSYTASHDSVTNTTKTREYFFLDEEIPQIFLSPSTSKDGSSQLIVEAGSTYDDSNGQTYDMTDGSSESISKRAFDIIDGNLSSSIVATIYSGLHDEDTLAFQTPLDSIDTSIPEATYTIRYDVNDIQQDGDTAVNAAIPQFRHIIVKDRTPPTLEIVSGGVNITVDYLDPDSSDLNSTIQTVLQGLSATDYLNIDSALDVISNREKWSVVINKDDETFDDGDNFSLNGVFPANRDDAGYNVWVRVTDNSGNEAKYTDDGTGVEIPIRYLKVGDYVPPHITLIGDEEIHDFLRYAGDGTTQKLFPDQPTSEDFNVTGFGGGAHRIMLANYSFVDPGAYAEDANLSNPNDRGSYDIQDYNYPDLDGDGIGETHALHYVSNYTDLSTCSQGPAIIHVHSEINTENQPISYFQAQLANDNNDSVFFQNSNQTDGNYSISEYNYDLNKSGTQRMRRTHIELSYRVRDGWDNFSEVVTRDVYIYESEKESGTAFYATPLDVSKYALYDQNSSGDSTYFLTSAEKDTDGDGVSDFWEVAFGTRADDASETPEINNENLHSLNKDEARARLAALPDYDSLKNFSPLDVLVPD